MEAKVVKIIDDYKLVINKGKEEKLKENDIFIIFEKGEELFDPDTNESLGILEIPKLKMRLISLQDKLSILESIDYIVEEDKIKKTVKKMENKNPFQYNLFLNKYGESEIIEEHIPGKKIKLKLLDKNVKIGDIARKIK